jgi:aromatic ring-opening dioxygenase catalytic subunit (LigB family)
MAASFRQRFSTLESSLKDLPRQLGDKPKAILVISGHWEEKDFAVMASPKPPMIYDYSGFPPELYRISYPAPGSPELAARVQSLIREAGLPAHLDPARGFDHGTYSVLKPIYPEADVPVVELSIQSGYDPAAHLELGRALNPLRDEGVLILGSGSSYHDLSMMLSRGGAYGRNPREESAQFDAWLRDTLVDSDSNERSERLLHWENAPFARAAHPQEDHLIPLHVAVGAAEEEPGYVIYHEDDFFGFLAVSSFRFGD